MGQYPSVNDRDYDLLKKIATNSAVIADSGGGGGGSSYSQSANFSSLPPAALFTGTTYLVLAAQGVYFVNRKPAGLYRSDGANWIYMADATEAYFSDSAAWGSITSKPSVFPPDVHATNHSNGGSDPVTITNLAGFTGDTTKFLRADGTFQTAGGGSGDVVGPASSVDDRIATFDGLTGKLIQDGGKTIATVLSDAASDATTKANAAEAAAIAASQPLDGDLTAIAALTPSNDDIIQRKAGAWTNRSIAQLISDLALTSSSVGLGNVTNDTQTKAAIVPNTAPAAGEILVGNAGGTAYAKQSMSGDATLSSAGALTIANSAITLAKMANIDGTAAEVLLGRSTASSGAPEVIATTGTRGSAVVLATSPTLVTPALGTPSALVLTNATGLPASAIIAGVLGGNVTLGEDVGQILLDPALSADGKWSGISETGTAGAALSFGDLCYFAVADSRWELADADAAATAGPVKLGICVLAAASDGDPTVMLLWGKVRADTAFPTLTVGAPVYVGLTAGDIAVTETWGTDDVIRVIGHANTADELFFHPSNDFITYV